MQWYTGNTTYDTLLIVGFIFALLVLSAVNSVRPNTVVDLAQKTRALASARKPDGC